MSSVLNEGSVSRGAAGRQTADFTLAIDDQRASELYDSFDSASPMEQEQYRSALRNWAETKLAEEQSRNYDDLTGIYADVNTWWSDSGGGQADDEVKYGAANRKFIAAQTGQTAREMGDLYPSERDRWFLQTFGQAPKTESEAYQTIGKLLQTRQQTKQALRELPSTLALNLMRPAATGTDSPELASLDLFNAWKERHADILQDLPEDWESRAMEQAEEIRQSTTDLMREIGPDAKKAWDILQKWSRPEANDAGVTDQSSVIRQDVEDLAKNLTNMPKDRQDRLFEALYRAAEATGAGMGKGFFEKVGEGLVRGGVKLYDDNVMGAEDRALRLNVTRLQRGGTLYEMADGTVGTQEEIARWASTGNYNATKLLADPSFQAGTGNVSDERRRELLDSNEQRLREMQTLRKVRQLAEGAIDPLKTELDGLAGSLVQGAYTFSQSAAYTAMAAIPYVGLPAVVYSLGNSNYFRMLDEYPDMDTDFAWTLSMAIGAPQAVVERFKANALLGKSPALNALMKKMTDARTPLAARIGVAYGANVAYQTGQEFIQEAMPVLGDQMAAAIREDMPQFDAAEAWGAYIDQTPEIFFSMLWAGLIGGGVVTLREFKRDGIFLTNVGELEMVGVVGETARDIAAEQDLDVQNEKLKTALNNRRPEDIQAGIAKRAAALEAAGKQQGRELPTRHTATDADGNLTHIIYDQQGKELLRTADTLAADVAYVGMVRQIIGAEFSQDAYNVQQFANWWATQDPKQASNDLRDARLPNQGITAEQKVQILEQVGNKQGIEELHRRIAQSPYAGTPYDQIVILGEASVEQVGDMVFRSVMTVYPKGDLRAAREEMHHTAVRFAAANGRADENTLRGWLEASERVFAESGLDIALPRADMTDIVESMAVVQEAFENERISADAEMSLPQEFVAYIKRMIQVFVEVLKRGKALREAFDAGALPSEFEAFLAETTGVADQTVVDRSREKTAQEVAPEMANYSIGTARRTFKDENGNDRVISYHLTDNSTFALNELQKPENNTTLGGDWPNEGIFVGPSAEMWFNGYNYVRPFVVELSHPPVESMGKKAMAAGGVGSEQFIPASEFKNVEILRVIPYDEYARETFGEFGPIEEYFEIDSEGNALPEPQAEGGTLFARRPTTALKNYRYSGQDVRQMSDEQRNKLIERTQKYARATRPQIFAQNYSIGSRAVLSEIDRVLDMPENPPSVQTAAQEGGKVRSIAKLFREIMGDDSIDYGSLTEEGMAERISEAGDRMLDVLLRAAYEFPQFASWYESRLKMALDIFTELDPDVAKPDNQAALLITLAITSNGADVATQTEDGWDVYNHWKNNGKLAGAPEKRGALRGAETENKLRLADRMAKVLGGYANLGKFLNRKGTVAKLRKAMAEEFGDTFTKKTILDLTNGELVTEVIPFSLVFGAKLGSFFNNMSGDFSTITMDRWFMRTFGRTMGAQLVAIAKNVMAKKDARLKQALKGYKGDILQRAKIAKSVKDPRQIAEALGKFFQKSENRSNLAEQENAIRLAANDLFKVADGFVLKEAPDSGTHRRWIRAVMTDAITKFNAQTNNQLVPAEAQALLWYYEKLIHDTYGSRQKDASPDYASAANKLFVRERGVGSNRFQDSDGIKRRSGGGRSQAFGSVSVSGQSGSSVSNYSIAAAQEQRKADVAITPDTPVAKSINGVSAEDIFASAKERFGITDSIYEAGYVLPDGTMLDFSGRSQASGYKRNGATFRPTDGKSDYLRDSRGIDHREIEWDGMPEYTETWGSMADFLRLGAVRIDGNSGTISMRSRLRPTSAQLRVLKDLVTSADGAYLDLEDDLGNGTAMMLESGKWTRVHGFLERWANGETPSVTRSYSISTQSEIDRVGAALNRLERSPLDSLGYTEKIRQRFAQIMAENMVELQAMQQGGVAERSVLNEEGNPIGPQPDAAKTKATGAEMRRTKFLQALGELDGLLSVLPPQVAAKVGGYTVLTNIGTGDRALSNFFIKRLEMIDKELERYLKDRYTTALKELFKRAKPKRDDAGKVPKGKLGAGVHTLFERLEEAVEMSSVEIDGEIASLEQQIASGELEPEQEAASILLSDSLPLFGEWKTADASRMAQAVQMGYDIYRIAYKKQQAKAMLRKNLRDQERIDAKDASGAPDDTAPVRQQNKNEAEQLKSKTKGIVTNLLGFDQLMSLVFGRDSAFTKKWVNWQRKSDNAKDDEFNAVYDQWSKFLATLTKHKKPYSMKATYAGQDLSFAMSEPKYKIKHTNPFGEDVEFTFSQADLLDITMMWMQPKGRAHMIGKLDDYGDPIDDWSYDQTFVNKAEALLTDEAKAIRDFLLNDYAEQWSELNEVFVKLNDINLPQEQFYSPLSVNPVQTTQNQTVDPLTGFAVAVPNRTPPSLRSRGAAVAEPVFSNAINKWFAHRLQMAHWKAYAEFNNEALSVLGHRNVRNAIEAKVGQAGLTSLQSYLTYFQQGGNRAADANLELTKALSGILGRAITMSLFGRIGTVLIQFTQLGAAAAKMPLHAYLRRFAKLMTGQMGWGEALKSPYIQRRINQQPPQVQVAMAGLRANKPSQIREAARRVGWLLSGNDGLATAGTYAMVYDYQLEQMKKAGMTGAQAEAAAREEAERAVDEIAQPTRAGARSAFELSQTSPMQTVAWAFGSEPRKNVALLAYLQRAKQPLSEKGRALLYVLLINGVFGAILRTMLRDLRDDEDDEIFDWDDTWSPKRLALMVLTEPLYGVPVLGEMSEEAIFRAFREYRPEGSLYSVADPAFSLSRMPEHVSNLLEGEVDGRRLVKDINNILRGFGYAYPAAAGAAALSNLGKEVYEMADNVFGDDDE